MNRHLADHDWDDDEEEDDFDSDEEDDSTTACPNCRKQVYDDAEQCPYCGHYLSEADRSGGKPWWVVIGAILCLLVAFYWLLV